MDKQIQNSGFHGPPVYRPLIRPNGPSSPVHCQKLVSICLDRGDDPNRAGPSSLRQTREAVSPLSAAIPPSDSFEADCKGFHISVFTAAHAVAVS